MSHWKAHRITNEKKNWQIKPEHEVTFYNFSKIQFNINLKEIRFSHF